MLHKNKSYLCLLISANFTLLLLTANSYILDEGFPIFIKPSSESNVKSHFGFSQDLHVDEQGRIRAFIGAPKDRQGWGQNPEDISGSFSVCDIDLNNGNTNCEVRKPTLTNADKNDSFTDQMLGFSIAATKDKVWTCAPRFQRYKQKKWSTNIQDYQIMLGHCFIFNENDDFMSNRHVVPLAEKSVFFGREGYEEGYAYGSAYSETGFSLHASDDIMFLGAPGAWNWTGTLVTTDTIGENPVMTQPWSPSEPILNDYTGFAVSSGKLVQNSQGNRPRQIVLGAPRSGRNRTGSVFAVEFHGSPALTQICKAEGRQIGEYFGSALATVDINGDGIDEVLVGAPFFVEDLKNRRYEQGRVSILEIDNKYFRERASLSGPKKSSGRFGSALVSLGDIDMDGYGDFAVGAPYEDDGCGAVHIYMGKKDIASIQEASQIIRARSLRKTTRGFGISFSKTLDVDRNGVPDIGVGCHDSEEVILLRTKPSATLKVESQSSVNSINLDSLEVFKITVKVSMKSRLKISGVNGKTKVKITIIKDSKTMFVDNNRNNNASFIKTVYENEETWVSQQVKLYNSGNKEPLLFEAVVEQLPWEDDVFCSECHILDPRIAYTSSVTVDLVSNCEFGKNCTCDLFVEPYLKEGQDSPFVIGSSKSLTIVVKTGNKEGGTAFGTTLTLPIPNKLSVIQLPGCKEAGDKILCSLGNILRDSFVSTNFTFDVSKLTAGDSNILFEDIRVTSAALLSEESNYIDNQKSLNIPLESKVDLFVSSVALPKVYDEKDEYLSFSQSFQIRNDAMSPVDDVESMVDVPTMLDGEPITWSVNVKMSDPITSEEIACKRKLIDDENNVTNSELFEAKDEDHITCDSSRVTCETFRCGRVELLNKSTVATISLNLNLDLLAIKSKNFQFSSKAVATSKYALANMDIKPNRVLATTFIELASAAILTSSIPVWLWVVVVIGALLVLLCIILCMTYLGFFKRKRMDALKEEKKQEEEMTNFVWKAPGKTESSEDIQFPESKDIIEERSKLFAQNSCN